MATIVLDYGARSAKAEKTPDYMLSAGFFKVKDRKANAENVAEKSPFSPEFVAETGRTEKQPSIPAGI
jgi:hypothetical protein